MVVSHRSQDFVDVFRKLSAESKATRHANAAFRAITLPATPMAHHDLKVSPDIFFVSNLENEDDINTSHQQPVVVLTLMGET